jgi:hypothetical protein
MSGRPPEREDLDAILDVLLRFAREQIQKRGELGPIGAVMADSGEVQLLAVDTGAEQRLSTEHIDFLRATMRRRAAAGEIRAAGIGFEATVAGPNGLRTDAIAVTLEHRAGDCVDVTMPYERRSIGRATFGDLIAGRGERSIFVQH